MAAMSAMSTAPTPPASSHDPATVPGNQNTSYRDAWDGFSSPGNDENPIQLSKKTSATSTYNVAANGVPRSPLISQNGNTNQFSSQTSINRQLSKEDVFGLDSNQGSMPGTAGYLSAPFGPRNTSSSDSLREGSGSSKSAKRTTADSNPPNEMSVNEASKWIHRDKLARIESEELQAAGIFLPPRRNRSRSRSRPRGHTNGGRSESVNESTRSRKNSSIIGFGTGTSVFGETKAQDMTVPAWDLRRPEEIADEMESNYWTSTHAAKSGSRIPVAKVSPAPIPVDYLDRDTPAARKRDSSPGEDAAAIKMPRTRARSSTTSIKEAAASAAVVQPKRSMTDSSPKKTSGPRKTSAPKATGAAGRPKTRGGPSKDSSSSSAGTRPTTRSGERELTPASPGNNKQPEGDPPWMINAFKPDPRLPPDQQLLPTVARRLQQEKWEREGKFDGNVYDKEFRPLSGDGFLVPPDRTSQLLRPPSREKAEETQPEKPAEEPVPDWPLKADGTSKNPSAVQSPNTSVRQNSLRQQRTGSYSTIPKVHDAPLSPIPTSRGNPAPGLPSPLVRVPDMPAEDEKAKEKTGCMCCVVM